MRRQVPDRSADQYPGESFAGAEGLQKFDLGMTPASVTPPPTWRRAAWFTVVTSAAALGGLILASSALVGYSRPPRGLDLPQEPSQGGYSPPGAAALPPPQGLGPGQTPQEDALPDDVGVGARQPARLPMVGGVVPYRIPGPPPGNAPAQPPWPDPSRADAVRQRCDQYFAALQDNDLSGAYAMTSGALHAAGFVAFAARYAAASSIEVTEVAVEPDHMVASVRLTRADGRGETQRHDLWLSQDADPTILADNLMQ